MNIVLTSVTFSSTQEAVKSANITRSDILSPKCCSLDPQVKQLNVTSEKGDISCWKRMFCRKQRGFNVQFDRCMLIVEEALH